MARRHDRFEALQKSLTASVGPLLLLTTFIGLLVQAVETLLKVDTIFGEHGLLLGTVFWLAGLLLVWRLKRNRRWNSLGVRIGLSIGVTLLYLAIVLYPYASIWWIDHGPAPNPRTDLGFLLLSSPAYARENVIEIVQFYPDEELSSFEDVMEPDFARGSGRIRTIAYNKRVETARQNGGCTGVEGDKPILAVLPLLDERLKRAGRGNLRPYVSGIDGYKRMMRHGGTAFLDVTFTELELGRMRTSDPAAYAVATTWLVQCVGVRHPMITLVLRNRSKRSIVISEIQYVVEKAFVTLGADAAAVTPSHKYVHILPHKDGTHRRPLRPPFKLDAGAVGAFSVLLRPDKEGPGLTWAMQMAVVDTDGERALTERFQLIMSKHPK